MWFKGSLQRLCGTGERVAVGPDDEGVLDTQSSLAVHYVDRCGLRTNRVCGLCDWVLSPLRHVLPAVGSVYHCLMPRKRKQVMQAGFRSSKLLFELSTCGCVRQTWRQHGGNHCTSIVMMLRTVMTSPRSTPDFDNDTRPSIDDLMSRGVCHPSAVQTR